MASKTEGLRMPALVLAVALIGGGACSESDADDPWTAGTGGTGTSTSSGDGGTGATGGSSTSTSTSTSGGGGGGSPNCGELLLTEDFVDNNLGDRGWYGGTSGSGYSVVNDAALGQNVYELAFEQGAQTPGGSVRHDFTESEEITLFYKLRVGPSWEWTVGHHLIMFHSNRDLSEGNGSPANAFGSTYLEWEWNDAGIFIGKFQDNRAINCNLGCQDLTSVTEDRSVGGCQTWTVPDGQDASYWGDPCQGGIDSYTGQSVLSLHTNGATHPMVKDEWWQVSAHLRMNTIDGGIGQWDGAFHVEFQGPNDASPVMVMDHQNVLWRAGGPNQSLAWAVFMIAPYLHDGAVAPMWIRMADLRIYEGECLNGVN